jgi:G3E family GTPase
MIDAQQGLRQLAMHEEAAWQIAAADVVLVTKTDLVPENAVEVLTRRIVALSPGVAVRTVLHGAIEPDFLFRLASESSETVPPAAMRDAHAAYDHHRAHADHTHGTIRSLAITTNRAVNWRRLRTFLESVFSLRGEAFLRVKGIIWTDDGGPPLLLQGVGNTFSSPRPLARDPEDPGCSRLVLIFQHLDSAALEQTFRAMVLDNGRVVDIEG